MPETTPRPAETCGASTGAIRLGDEPPHHIGPCVLRKDHDGPVHQAQDGTQWAGDVGRAPEAAPRPDVPDELIVRAAKASSVHFEHCDDGETWQDCPDCRRAYDRAHYAVAAVVPVIERRVRERVAAELRAAAHAIEDSTGEIHDRLAEEIWGTCERDPEAPAVRDDPRTIAAVAYRHIAYRIDGEAR